MKKAIIVDIAEDSRDLLDFLSRSKELLCRRDNLSQLCNILDSKNPDVIVIHLGPLGLGDKIPEELNKIVEKKKDHTHVIAISGSQTQRDKAKMSKVDYVGSHKIKEEIENMHNNFITPGEILYALKGVEDEEIVPVNIKIFLNYFHTLKNLPNAFLLRLQNLINHKTINAFDTYPLEEIKKLKSIIELDKSLSDEITIEQIIDKLKSVIVDNIQNEDKKIYFTEKLSEINFFYSKGSLLHLLVSDIEKKYEDSKLRKECLKKILKNGNEKITKVIDYGINTLPKIYNEFKNEIEALNVGKKNSNIEEKKYEILEPFVALYILMQGYLAIKGKCPEINKMKEDGIINIDSAKAEEVNKWSWWKECIGISPNQEDDRNYCLALKDGEQFVFCPEYDEKLKILLKGLSDNDTEYIRRVLGCTGSSNLKLITDFVIRNKSKIKDNSDFDYKKICRDINELSDIIKKACEEYKLVCLIIGKGGVKQIISDIKHDAFENGPLNIFRISLDGFINRREVDVFDGKTIKKIAKSLENEDAFWDNKNLNKTLSIVKKLIEINEKEEGIKYIEEIKKCLESKALLNFVKELADYKTISELEEHLKSVLFDKKKLSELKTILSGLSQIYENITSICKRLK